MKLIRRRKSKPPIQKALDAVRLGVRGLVVVRFARNAFKTYRFARRLPLILGGAAVAFLAARKLRGGDDSAEPVPYEPPPAAAPRPASSPAATAPADAAPSEPEPATADTAGDGAPSPAALAEGGGEMPTSPDLDVEAPNESAPGRQAGEAGKKA